MNTFPHVKPIDENFFANIRMIILFTQLLGGIGLFLLIVEPLSKLLLKPEENQEIKLDVEEESLQKLSMKTIGYSLLLGIPGIIIFVPVILILYLATAGFILALLFGQAFGYLLLLWMLGRKRNFNGERLWARGYAVSTVGFEEEQVRCYIKNQEQLDQANPDGGGEF